jgi:hypothetical protein
MYVSEIVVVTAVDRVLRGLLWLVHPRHVVQDVTIDLKRMFRTSHLLIS